MGVYERKFNTLLFYIMQHRFHSLLAFTLYVRNDGKDVHKLHNVCPIGECRYLVRPLWVPIGTLLVSVGTLLVPLITYRVPTGTP